MAYTAPTADDFVTRFPKFASTDEYLIEAILAEAITQVDDSWIEQDYRTAILYLTAHLLTQETGSQADRPGTIASESFGPMSISYGTGKVATVSNLDATEYGRRFKDLRNRNFPGVEIV